MKSLLKFALTLAAFVFVGSLFAQGTPNQDPDLQVPVDGGIFTVVGSAIAYGVYKVRNKKSTDI
jgi:hypothetical protein